VRKFFRIALKSMAILAGFLILVFLFINLPFSRKFVTGRVNTLFHKLELPISMQEIRAVRLKTVKVEGFSIAEPGGDTIIYAGKVKAEYHLLGLIRQKVKLDQVVLEQISVSLKTNPESGKLHIAEVFKKDKKKKPPDPVKKKPNWEISFKKGELSTIHFDMEDPSSGILIQQDVDQLRIKKFRVSLPEREISAHTLELSEGLGNIKLSSNDPAKREKKVKAGPPWNYNARNLSLEHIEFSFEQAVDGFLLNLDLEKGTVKSKQLNIPEKIIEVDEISMDGVIAEIYTGRFTEKKKEKPADRDFPWDIRSKKINLGSSDLFTGDYSLYHADSSASGSGLENLELKLRDFRMSSDDVGMNIKKMSFNMDTDFSLKDLQANLDSDAKATSLDLTLKTGRSSFRMAADAQEGFFKLLKDPAGLSRAKVQIPPSLISLRDVRKFNPQLEEIPAISLLERTPLELRLQAEKARNIYRLSELQLSQNSNFNITLDGYAENPFDTVEASGEVDLAVSEINMPWLKELFAVSGFESPLPDSAILSLNAHISNIFTLPELRLSLAINKGVMDVNGFLDYPDQSYDLSSRFNQIHLGEFLDNPQLGSFTGSLEITGSGFSPDNHESSLSLQIDSLGYGGYDYTRTRMSGKIRPGYYIAGLVADDPSLRGNLDVIFIQSDSLMEASANGSLFAQLDHLDYFKDSLAVESNLSASFRKDPEGIESQVFMDEVKLTSPREFSELNQLQASFNTNSEMTILSGASDFFNLDLTVGIPADEMERLGEGVSEYMSSFIEAEDSISETRLLKLHEASAHGKISYHNALGMILENYEFHFTDLDFSMDHHAAENSLRYHVSGNDIEYASARAGWMDLSLVDSAGAIDLSLRAEKSSLFSDPVNTITLTGQFAQQKSLTEFTVLDTLGRTTYKVQLSSEIDSNEMVLKIPERKFVFSRESWILESPELLRLDLQSRILSPNLRMYNDSSSIFINSFQKEGSNTYQVDLNQVDLASILPYNLLPGEPGGLIKGSIAYAISDQDQKRIETDLDLVEARYSDLNYEEVLVKGFFILSDSGDYELDFYARLDSAEMKVEGWKTDSLSREVRGSFSKIPLNTMQPFTEEHLSDLGGSVSGDVNLLKREDLRKMDGQLTFHGAEAKVMALNSLFRIPDQSISFTDNRVVFNRFSVQDSLGKSLIVDGSLNYGKDQALLADLDISSNNLQVMNTGEEDNNSFYGKVFVDSEFSVRGPVTKPSVDGRILVSNNTEVFYKHMDDLSLSDAERTVSFVSHEPEETEPLANPISRHNTFIESSIETLVEIDPSTLLNFELSKRIYNVALKVQGGGLLNYNMLNNNQVSLSGSYEISDGSADLKLVGWPDKAFTISEGSLIRWDGRAEDPQLNLEAINTVSTNYVNPVDGKSREVDINVLLKLSNNLSNLDILLTINTADQYLMSIINTMSPEEQMRQAYTILLFEIIDMPGISASNDYVTQQVNQILAAQLNQLTAATIKGVDISFGLDTYSQYEGSRESKTSLSYEVKKFLLNDRAEIEVSGRLHDVNESPGAQDVSMTNLSFAYRLDSAGSRYLKVYNEHTYEDVFEGEVIKTGVGYAYRKRYKSFRDIWRRKNRDKKKKNKGKE